MKGPEVCSNIGGRAPIKGTTLREHESMLVIFVLHVAMNSLDRFMSQVAENQTNVTHLLTILNVTDIHEIQDIL